jgi:UDP-N-acetylglucosamine transferase subunit ALG13
MGWPGKKKFALVLVHDVDTTIGLNNCLKLMDLEIELGFISSFNFVPADYDTPIELRQHIVNSGFEIGVHGLTHNGRTFRDSRAFSKLVPKINRYTKEWNAVGFSSPSMLSNLRWVADLDIEYSCSSFDTDPFEPRPFGVSTIFPFEVTNTSKSKSYVELPYTLPQDHSLFIILKEKDITTWKNKLDWVAEQGGLALINTHPDYMDFEADDYSYDKYPARNYAALLMYIVEQYKGQYWNCLPRSVARFWSSSFPNGTKYDYEGTEITAANRVAIYSRRIKYDREVKLALTCAPGGHFEQMQNIFDLYKDYPHFWITDKTVQTEYSLSGESGHFIKKAHFKRPWTYVAQVPLVYKILKKEQPTHMLSTGSGMIVFIPFLLSRLLNIKFIHIETFSHVNNLTKMGRLLLKLRQPVLSQWEGINHKNVRSIGMIITDQMPVSRFLRGSTNEKIVFVTLGTRSQPFSRIVESVEGLIKDNIISEKVIIQLGSTQYQTKLMETFDFCSPAEIDKLIGSSKYIITQESAGIVTKCLKLGKRFIVMPRDYKYKELPTKSDMNEDLHFRLEEMGFTYIVNDKEQLKEAILKIDQLKTGFHFDNSQALDALRKMIEGA